MNGALGVIDLMLAQNKITADAAEEAREDAERRVVGGRLRRGNEVYAGSNIGPIATSRLERRGRAGAT